MSQSGFTWGLYLDWPFCNITLETFSTCTRNSESILNRSESSHKDRGGTYETSEWNTAIAKTSGRVRRITLRESPGSDLSFLIIFIVYEYECRSFLTAEAKEKYLEIPDFYSFFSIWPLMETSYVDVPI